MNSSIQLWVLGAAQAAAVAAGLSNAVIEATCRVGVRPCRPRACVMCVCERARGDRRVPRLSHSPPGTAA